MATLYDIRERAEALSRKLEAGSITPEEVGQLIVDLTDYTQGMERDGSTLGIGKVYPTLEAMQADTAPVGDNGKPLRRGNLVAIYQESTAQTDPNSGLVCMWTGVRWVAIARIGTAMRHEYTSIESRVTELERGQKSELKPSIESIKTALEAITKDVKKALDRLEFTEGDREKLDKINTAGKKSNYLGADGNYHVLPVQSVEVNGVAMSSDANGKVSITTPQGTVKSFTFNGTKLMPDEGGDLGLGLKLATELLDSKRVKVALLTADGLELSSIELAQGGASGGGAGFLNISREVPLSTGYYSLSSALTALRSLAPDASLRSGMIITFESTEGVWSDYRYVGTTTDDTSFFSAPLWQEYAKAVTDEHIKDLIAKSGKEVEVAESLDETHRPVSSVAVKQAIDELRDATLDSDVEKTDDGSKVTLSRNGKTVAEFVVAGGGGGGQSASTKAVVTAQLSAGRIKLGDQARLTYGYTHYSDGEVDGVPATIAVTVKRGVQTLATLSLGALASGSTASLDLSKYLTTADTYSILVSAKYEEEGVVKERKAQALLSVVNLSIDLYNRNEIETYLSAGGYKDGDTASIILSVRGGAREVTMLIDGDEGGKEVRPLTGGGSRQTFSLPVRSLSPGRHSVQFVASVDGLLSNSIYLDVLKFGADTSFVGLIFSRPDGHLVSAGETPEVLAHQYEEVSWSYIAVSRRAGGVSQLTLTTPSGSTVFSTPRTFQEQSSRFTQQGLLDYSYTLEDATRAFKVKVVPTTQEGLGIKEGAVVELLTAGRSNVESDPSVWRSGKTSTHFIGVDFISSGWTGESLRLINGAKAEIGYKPFATDAKTRGLTLTFEARMTNVRRPDGAVISCIDAGAQELASFAGFAISASKVQMPTGGKLEFRTEDGETITRDLGLEMPYAYGEYYSLTLVVHPASEEHTIRLYINGVLSKADTYQDTLFAQRTPRGILLDSTSADLEIRHVRIYETALTDDEVLTNYITDRPTLSEMEELRERNDLLNPDTGSISYDKLVNRGKAVLSIAMPDGGLERLWGKSTDTKTDYTFTELIFRSPYGKAYDLRVTDGVIRRQGTSTSTYPIKNLRIYLQKSKTTKVYRNVGKGQEDQWEEVSTRTYVMREGAKPMKIINLKTDYADSSLCYNTGTAILLNDYLVAKNPSLRNAGQQADPSVRMAIDGMPIDVFTSDTPEGEKTYCGQFQLNNDKSKSGYLFGQTKTDGSEIALEFINNTNPVANFHITASSVEEQLGRTGTDGFDASVEFLFPEMDYTWNGKTPDKTAPANIKQAVVRLWKFIKDCTPTGADPSSMSEVEVKQAFQSPKFRKEVAQYFDVTNLTMWWVLTDYHMSVDQRVKNTFYRTWGNGIWWLTYYDGDTAFGKRNDAFLAYLYNITRDTRDAQRSKYAFEGHNSRLWCLVLANLEEEIKASAKLMRATLTNSVYLSVFNRQIMGNWSERQYNKSGIYKYIRPTYTDYNGGGTMNYIFALSGTMYAYRNQLIERRFSMLDAKYLVGQYESDAVTGYIGKDDKDTIIKATASDDYYFAWKTQNGKLTEHQSVQSSGVAVFNFRDAMSQNDPVRLIGASRMRRLDFATTAPHLQGAWNLNSGKSLEEIVATTDSPSPTQWYPLLSKITGLRHIDLTGQRGITGTEDEQARTFDVSSHTGLEQLKLGGTSVRAVRIAEGSPISLLELPATLSYLRLRALPRLSLSGLTLADWSKVTSLELAGCPLIDWRALLDSCVALERLRIEGVDFEDDGSLLRKLSGIKGIDANGSAVDTCELVGKCQLSVYVDEETIKAYRQHFPSLVIRQPDYTMIEFDDNVADPANISNLDNRTGYKYGSPYQPSAHVAKILSERFGCVGKQETKGTMKIFRLHNDNWYKFADHLVQSLASDSVLDMSQGDVFIHEPEYWYKGVNDVLRGKKYACFASGERPSSPKVDTVTFDQLEALGQKMAGYAVQVGNTSPSSALVPNEGYTAYKVRVKGYKRVRFQSVLSIDARGASFFTANDKLLSSVSVETGASNFADGMYLIADIPDSAEWLYFCVYNKVQDTDKLVVLSNSSKIEDMEPLWVHHKATLVGAFRGSLVGGKLGSAVQTGVDNAPTKGYSYEGLAQSLETRGLKVMSYDQYKNIANLAFLKYGTRLVQKITGSFDDDGNWRHLNGYLIRSGIHDSQRRADGAQGIYAVTGETKTWVPQPRHAKVMGYERLNGGWYEHLRGAKAVESIPQLAQAFSGQAPAVLDVIHDDGVSCRVMSARIHNETPLRLSFGLYMDIFPLTPYQYGRATSTTFYGGTTRIWEGDNRLIMLGDRYYDRGMIWLTTYPESNSNITFRVMFDGKIEEVRDLEVFKALPINY